MNAPRGTVQATAIAVHISSESGDHYNFALVAQQFKGVDEIVKHISSECDEFPMYWASWDVVVNSHYVDGSRDDLLIECDNAVKDQLEDKIQDLVSNDTGDEDE